MHDVIDVNQDILKKNDHIAQHINEDLKKRNIFTLNVMGAPGIGKTTTLIGVINKAKESGLESSVIEGDIESSIDTDNLKSLDINATQINTFGACHLDAPLIHNAVSNLTLKDNSLLFIENVGNLVCPAEFSIGEDIKMLICSPTEGSDKPYKYPLAFEKADIIVLNKIDLLDYLDFDEKFWLEGIRKINKDVPVIKVSNKNDETYQTLLLEILKLKDKK